jgi:hypothetical protein
MMGRVLLSRSALALCCLVVAACAASKSALNGEPVAATVPVAATPPAADRPTVAPPAVSPPESRAAAPPARPAPEPPPPAAQAAPPAVPAPTPAAPVATPPARAAISAAQSPTPAAPALPPAARAPTPPARSPSPAAPVAANTLPVLAPPAPALPETAAPDTLNFSSLGTRLRETKAIGVLTKISVKNQADDLLEKFRAYHNRQSPTTLVELRSSYELLVLKILSLVQDGDPPLAREIDRSRAAIWDILADQRKFIESNLMSGA